MKSKLQKLLKIYQKFDILQIWPWLCTMGMFLLTLKNIPVSLSFIVTEIWPGQNINSKSVFLVKTLTIFSKIKFWFFCFTTSVGMLCMATFSFFFSMKGSWRYGSDKGSVTNGHTDGRTYTEGRIIYVSRRGRHIITCEHCDNLL